MKGWLYLVKNRDLYKIGITKNFERRIRQLRPDNVVAKIYTRDFKELEKELHKRYKNVRIPQTEYFRLDTKQIGEIKQILIKYNYSNIINFLIFRKSSSLVLFIFLLLIILLYLTINDINNLLFISLLCMERISFFLAFLSLVIKSENYFGFINEIKFRISKLCIFLLFAFLFRTTSSFLF